MYGSVRGVPGNRHSYRDEQSLLNLYINAWQAMPGGGDLYVQTENVILDAVRK